MKYLKGSFVFDFIAVFPIQYMNLPAKYKQFTYLLNLFRVPKLFMLLDSKHFKNIIKKYFNHRLEITKNNMTLSLDKNINNNNIML